MSKIYFDVEDNVVIKSVPAPQIGENIYTQEVVIDKDTFIKCYEKWIKAESEVSDADLEAVSQESLTEYRRKLDAEVDRIIAESEEP